MSEFEIELLKQFKVLNLILKELTATIQVHCLNGMGYKEKLGETYESLLQDRIDTEIYEIDPNYDDNGNWKGN